MIVNTARIYLMRSINQMIIAPSLIGKPRQKKLERLIEDLKAENTILKEKKRWEGYHTGDK